MKLPIYLYGHPVLRRESAEITPDYPELQMTCGRQCIIPKVADLPLRR